MKFTTLFALVTLSLLLAACDADTKQPAQYIENQSVVVSNDPHVQAAPGKQIGRRLNLQPVTAEQFKYGKT